MIKTVKSRYKDYWYGAVLQIVKSYDKLKSEESEQAKLYLYAINEALEEIRKMPDGDFRVRAMEMIYLKRTHTIDGAALEVYTSDRTMKRWCNTFIRTVAKKAGF